MSSFCRDVVVDMVRHGKMLVGDCGARQITNPAVLEAGAKRDGRGSSQVLGNSRPPTHLPPNPVAAAGRYVTLSQTAELSVQYFTRAICGLVFFTERKSDAYTKLMKRLQGKGNLKSIYFTNAPPFQDKPSKQ